MPMLRPQAMQSLQRLAVLVSTVLLLLLCLPLASATRLPPHLHATSRLRAASQLGLDAAVVLDSEPQEHLDQGQPQLQGRRQRQLLQSTLLPASPAPIRILPELQLPRSLPAAQRTKVQNAVQATIAILAMQLQVRQPVGPSGLLVAPQYYPASLCNRVRQQGSTSYTCAGPGFFPSFNASLPRTDILAPFCGTARINPAHMMDARVCGIASGPDAGSVDVNCTASAAGTNSGGAQTDTYLYVTADSADCDQGTLAYAATCLYDVITNRPVMSYFNVCPLALGTLPTQGLVSTMVHELIHALGFSPDLWDPSGTGRGPSLFITDTGNPIPASSVIATLPADPNRGPGRRVAVPMVVTPTVVREVRSHFGCPTLVGAALEDQGGAGSEGSHWEYDLYQGDIMTPQAPADADWQQLTRITLALLEDSGWYHGNWSQAPRMQWGRGAGCSFPTLTCSRYRQTVQQQPYFCDETQDSTSCTFNGRSFGVCVRDTFSRCGLVTTPTPSASSNNPEPACVSRAYARLGPVGPAMRCEPGLVGPPLDQLSDWPCRPATCSGPGQPAVGIHAGNAKGNGTNGTNVTSSVNSTRRGNETSRTQRMSRKISTIITRALLKAAASGTETLEYAGGKGTAALSCPLTSSATRTTSFANAAASNATNASISAGANSTSGGGSAGGGSREAVGEALKKASSETCPYSIGSVCATLRCSDGGCSTLGGDCLDGKCVCRLGYSGPRCGMALFDLSRGAGSAQGVGGVTPSRLK